MGSFPTSSVRSESVWLAHRSTLTLHRTWEENSSSGKEVWSFLTGSQAEIHAEGPACVYAGLVNALVMGSYFCAQNLWQAPRATSSLAGIN